jgi:2-keto-3-deoxy-6-phosphogluconate aldolase
MKLQQQDFLLSANKYHIPDVIAESPGIKIEKSLVRSVLLSTDLAYIQNMDADSIMTVNPFEKSMELNKVLVDFVSKPVFSDVGGGLLREEQIIEHSKNALQAGSSGVVISKPTAPEIIHNLKEEVDGMLIYTLMLDAEPVQELAHAGVDIFNITTGEVTAESVKKVRDKLPEISIMASGGPHDSTIRETISAGADAIVFNPPTASEILRSVFDTYRSQQV